MCSSSPNDGTLPRCITPDSSIPDCYSPDSAVCCSSLMVADGVQPFLPCSELFHFHYSAMSAAGSMHAQSRCHGRGSPRTYLGSAGELSFTGM